MRKLRFECSITGFVLSLSLLLQGCFSAGATVEIQVEPQETSIFVEGEFRGKGQATLKEVAPGTLHLRLDTPVGWVGRRERIEVTEGKSSTHQFKMESQTEFRERNAEAAAVRLAKKEAWRTDPTLPRVRMKTSLGDIELILFEEDAPNTVSNFVALVERGFYDKTRFHRVIQGFMIQGGDPNSKDRNYDDDGKGGPPYTFPDELNSRKHEEAGTLSMANAGPNTNGSQFFITLAATPHLDVNHTVFGAVAQGMEVVRKIGGVPVVSGSRPKTDLMLETIEILRKRDHKYIPMDAQGEPLPLPPPAK